MILEIFKTLFICMTLFILKVGKDKHNHLT